MTQFRYWRDPVCLAACVAYAVNRWILKPHFVLGTFMRGHFADCLLIPAALPLVLWLQRRLTLRTHDALPTGGEILLHLAIWTFIAEGAGPFLTHHGTADWWDVAAYSAGAAVCYVLWHRREIPCRMRQSPVPPSLVVPYKMAHPLSRRSLARMGSEPPATQA